MPHSHALSQGAAPEASTPFVKQLSARLRAAALDEDAQSVQSRSRCAARQCSLQAPSNVLLALHLLPACVARAEVNAVGWRSTSGLGSHLVDTDLPFELRVLEAALDLAGRCFGDEVAALERQGLPMLDSIVKRVPEHPESE